MARRFYGGRKIRGLSTDTKPSAPETDSEFEETDTGNRYKFDGSNWKFAGTGKMVSTDTKPAQAETNATITETDTKKIFDYSGSAWVERATVAGAVLTNKGDIVGFDTARKRIGIGSDDQVLTADSTNANGLAWKDTSGGGTYTTLSTSNASYSPSTQTGNMDIIIDNTKGTVGGVNLIVDNNANGFVGSGESSSRVVNPSTNVKVSTTGDFAVSGDKTEISTQTTGGWTFTQIINSVTGNDSGTKVFVNGYNPPNNFTVKAFNLSTPYDLSTASLYNTSSSWGWIYGLFYINSSMMMRANGSTATLLNMSGDNPSTASANSSFNTGVSNMRGLGLFNNGTYLVCGYTGSSMKAYNLSTAYDLSTATIATSPSITTSGVKAVQFNSSGDTFAFMTAGTCYAYECSTPFDLSTATFKESTGVQSSSSGGTILRDSSKHMYSGSTTMKSYSFASPFSGTLNLKTAD
jgi:hypothetical protein